MTNSSLRLAGAGLCCALGYRLETAVWALRANMDHFEESSFDSGAGEPICVAALPDNLYGAGRMARWCEFAVRDCADSVGGTAALVGAGATLILVLGADPLRPHASAQGLRRLVDDVLAALPAPARRWDVEVLQEGRTGVATALLRAARALAHEEVQQVLVLGIDSLLNAADISRYLSEKRLFIRGNSNGFIPGEAAAAVLLRGAPSDSEGVHVRGVGRALEVGRHDGSVPSRGQGLTKAIRDACTMADTAPAALAFRLSDHNGEQFFASEASNAMTRIMAGSDIDMQQLTIADKIGEVGAAAGAAMLAWLWADMRSDTFSPGSTGLMHLAGEDGTRCAVVLTYVGGK